MNLNSVTLNKTFCALLYKSNLIYPDNDKSGTKKVVDFLGNNEKGIIFLVNDASNKFLDDTQWKFFNDLLNACNLTMADIAVINFYHHNISFEEINRQFNPSRILIFGIDPQQLDMPFHIPHFQVQNYQGLVLALCPTLAQIQNGKELKKKLWIALQKIFNLQTQK